MTTDLRILLATPHAGYEQRVRRAFDGRLNGDLRRWDLEGDNMATPDDLFRTLSASNPDVVAIGPDVEIAQALGLARHLERDRPEISVLLIGELTPGLWQEALRSGIRDVLAPDAVDAVVRAAFDRALDVAARRRANLVGEAGNATSTGRIITVLSPKGGAGKTTVSANLALGLALAVPDSAVVVDLDLQFGDIATALRLTPAHTLLDVVRAPAPADAVVLDGMMLKSFLTPHPSTLWALCGPEAPADGEEIGVGQVTQAVRTLAEQFGYVVVDTGAGLSEHALSVLEISTDVVLVCTMDVPSVRGLRKEIDALDLLGMTGQRRHLVVNRADSKVGLDVHDVEAVLGMPIDVALPSTRAIPLSLNQGSPVLESEPRSAVARQLARLVGRFAPSPATDAGPLRRRRAQR